MDEELGVPDKSDNLKLDEIKHSTIIHTFVTMVAHFVCLLFTGFIIYKSDIGSSMFSFTVFISVER